MKWFVIIMPVLLLTACYLDSPVIDTRDVVVADKPVRLQLGNDCRSIDVTHTIISKY